MPPSELTRSTVRGLTPLSFAVRSTDSPADRKCWICKRFMPSYILDGLPAAPRPDPEGTYPAAWLSGLTPPRSTRQTFRNLTARLSGTHTERLAEALGGDHAFDAARILRLPGTRNFKDPERPVAVEIEVLAADRVYNLSEIEDALDMVAPRSTAGTSAGRSDLDARVLALLDKHARLRALFEGTGKPEMGEDGRRLDTTSSGYDFSLALALGRRGIKEPELLANAIRNRPDGAARAKGEGYISRTVARALERIALVEAEDGPDFEVERIRVFSSNPPIYELVIEGTAIRMGSAELSSPRLFSLRYMNALRRIPELPEKAGWTRWVNEKLAHAEVVEQPPEASDEEALREAVGTVITDLPVGTEAVDLDHGKALELDGGLVIFKVDSVLRSLKEDFPALRRHELCRVLRDLGFVSGSHAAPGKTVRAWSNPSHTRVRESR